MPSISRSLPSAEAPEITPFWQRLPFFFRYPLHWQPLLYMLFLSLFSLLVLVSPLIGGLINLGASLAFIRYAYRTLDQTSQGLLSPDQHQQYDAEGRAYLPYKQALILFLIAIVLSFSMALGGLVFGFVLICSILMLPASVMQLSITSSFWAAINPLAAISMISAVGLSYLGLCGFLFLLTVSQGMALEFIVPHLPEWLVLPGLTFIGMYFTLIMFNMMGYVIYQYHHILGFQISSPKNEPRRGARISPAEAQENGVNSIGELIAAGQIDQALDFAYEAQRIAPDDLSAHERYHKLLLLAKSDDRLLSHAKRYLTALLNKNQSDMALSLYRTMSEYSPTFEPALPGQLLQLAQAAKVNRDFKGALLLLKGFDKRFPRHAEIPAVYLFAARVLCEHLRQDDAARSILAVIGERYPQHPLASEAEQLLKTIDQLQQKAKS